MIVFLLVLCLLFSWLMVRSVRAGHGKLLFWLAWFLVGLAVILSGALDVTPVSRWFVDAWALSVVGLPAWWSWRALVRVNRWHV